MLTSKQYEAVGRLALAMNELEYSLEFYTAVLLGTPEWSVSALLAAEGMFDQKAKRFDAVLEVISNERPLLGGQITPLREYVKKARDLAKERNRYVHALVVHDFERNKTSLRGRRENFECDEVKITYFADSADDLAFQIANDCGALHVNLEDLRGGDR